MQRLHVNLLPTKKVSAAQWPHVICVQWVNTSMCVSTAYLVLSQILFIPNANLTSIKLYVSLLFSTPQPSCSLHLSQRFSQYYPGSRSVPILSKESAPGMIMGTGTMGANLGASTNFDVFKSSSAGASWYKVRRCNLSTWPNFLKQKMLLNNCLLLAEMRRILVATNGTGVDDEFGW